MRSLVTPGAVAPPLSAPSFQGFTHTGPSPTMVEGSRPYTPKRVGVVVRALRVGERGRGADARARNRLGRAGWRLHRAGGVHQRHRGDDRRNQRDDPTRVASNDRAWVLPRVTG